MGRRCVTHVTLWLALLASAGLAPVQARPMMVLTEGATHAGWEIAEMATLSCCHPASMHAFADQPFSGLDERASALTLDEPQKDSDGLKRDTLYFAGYQFVAVAILYAMPESVTNWTEEDKQGYSFSKYWNNVTSPQMDSDDFYLNYVIHPYWGASYFVRARERGYSPGESFWYSVLLSTMFEYGAEALAEEPSYQDLVITPTLGSLVGLWFMDLRDGVRDRSARRGYRSTGDKWIWALTDPLGGLNGQVDRLFGVEAELSFAPYVALGSPITDPFARPFAPERADESVVGFKVTMTW